MTATRLLNVAIIATLYQVLSAGSTATAGIVTFEITVDQSEVTLGHAVNWNLFATISNSTSSNWGISTVAANIFDSRNELLNAGTVSGPFASYSFTSGGTFDPTSSKLLEITAVQFNQNSSTSQAIDPSNSSTNNNLGPLLLASGSYVPLQLGTHTLSTEPGSANSFFTAQGQTIGSGGTHNASGPHGSVNFVVAVPEPTNAVALLIASAVTSRLRRRRMRA